MDSQFFDRQTFERLDFTDKPLQQGEYEYCTFIRCNFSNIVLSNTVFSECQFISCDMSMIKTSQTGLMSSTFKDSKLLGANFENCTLFSRGFHFEDCLLNLASFYKLNTKNTLFKNCKLHETNFMGTDLTGSIFDNCDCMGTLFEGTILEKVDLRSSYNYLIDPEKNRIKKTKFSMAGTVGLLSNYDIEIF